MKRERLLELAGVPIEEGIARNRQLANRAARAVAELMMAHYENPVESPYEWFEEEHEEIATWIADNIDDMYGQDTKPFRQEVMRQLARLMKV